MTLLISCPECGTIQQINSGDDIALFLEKSKHGDMGAYITISRGCPACRKPIFESISIEKIIDTFTIQEEGR